MLSSNEVVPLLFLKSAPRISRSDFQKLRSGNSLAVRAQEQSSLVGPKPEFDYPLPAVGGSLLPEGCLRQRGENGLHQFPGVPGPAHLPESPLRRAELNRAFHRRCPKRTEIPSVRAASKPKWRGVSSPWRTQRIVGHSALSSLAKDVKPWRQSRAAVRRAATMRVVPGRPTGKRSESNWRGHRRAGSNLLRIYRMIWSSLPSGPALGR